MNKLSKVVIKEEDSFPAWDSNRLRDFVFHFGVRYKDLAEVLGTCHTNVVRMTSGDRPVEQYSKLLEAYKDAVMEGKIAELRANSVRMEEYYKSFK